MALWEREHFFFMVYTEALLLISNDAFSMPGYEYTGSMPLTWFMGSPVK